MVDPINTALVGIQKAGERLEISARKIASANITPPTLTQQSESAEAVVNAVPQVDIAKELIEQKLAAYDYKANLQTIKVAANLQKSLLDIFT